jgi:hypothetical protein
MPRLIFSSLCRAAGACGLAALLLAGCDREPARTVVVPPRDAPAAALAIPRGPASSAL